MLQARSDVADFSYETPEDAAGLPARVSVFTDSARRRREIAEDLTGAGFGSVEGGEIADLLDGPVTRLGDVVLVERTPALDEGLEARTLAALMRLDMRIAQSGAHLIVTTTLEALDDVFAAFDQSKAQILVQPTRAERVVAVGRVLTGVSNSRVREMSEHDRLSLLRLSEQVEAIAKEIDRMSSLKSGSTERLRDFTQNYAPVACEPVSLSDMSKRRNTPALPDPGEVRRMIAARQARSRFFDAELFSDPAWDMLLDLTAAHAEKVQVSVTSLCIAANVPATTALRWLKQMVESGVFMRVADPDDRRRAFIELSEASLEAMARYFEAIETPLAHAA